MGFLLAGDRLAPEAPGALPHGEEDLGEAFDFEDSDEEDDEDSAAEAEPSRGAVLQAPPRRRRATSSSIGEAPAVSPNCPLWVAEPVLCCKLGHRPHFSVFFPLQRGWCWRPRKGKWGFGVFWGENAILEVITLSLACPSFVLCLVFSILFPLLTACKKGWMRGVRA